MSRLLSSEGIGQVKAADIGGSSRPWRRVARAAIVLSMVLATTSVPYARADQLLDNASFQTDTDSDIVPDGWFWGGVDQGYPPGITPFIDTTEVEYDVTMADWKTYAQIAQPLDMSAEGIIADDVLVLSIWAKSSTSGARLQTKIEYFTSEPDPGSGDHTALVHQIKSSEFVLTSTKTRYFLGTEVPSGASLTWVAPTVIFLNESGGSSVEIEISSAKLEHRNDFRGTLKNPLSLKQSTFDVADDNPTGGTGWTSFGSGTISFTTEGVDCAVTPCPYTEGVRSLEITVDGSASGQGIIMDPTVPVTEGHFYTLSCSIKGSGSQPQSLRIQWRNSGGGVISSSKTDFTASTSWQLITVTNAEAPDNAAQAAPASTSNSAPQSERVWNLDKCQFEENSTNTTWVPGTTGDIQWP
jgi:hypothetical protein